MPVWEKMLCCSQHQVPRCGMDSRGTIHLEMLKTWRLLTSAIRVMSCSLSSCSPAACCSTVVPLSDLCVRQMCIFATWGTEVPQTPQVEGNTASVPCREHLSKLQKETKRMCHGMAVEAQDSPAMSCCMSSSCHSLHGFLPHWSLQKTHPITHSFC